MVEKWPEFGLPGAAWGHGLHQGELPGGGQRQAGCGNGGAEAGQSFAEGTDALTQPNGVVEGALSQEPKARLPMCHIHKHGDLGRSSNLSKITGVETSSPVPDTWQRLKCVQNVKVWELQFAHLWNGGNRAACPPGPWHQVSCGLWAPSKEAADQSKGDWWPSWFCYIL